MPTKHTKQHERKDFLAGRKKTAGQKASPCGHGIAPAYRRPGDDAFSSRGLDFPADEKGSLLFRDISGVSWANTLPDKIMINVHPQRWHDRPLPWVKELILQNLKNCAKYMLIKTRG